MYRAMLLNTYLKMLILTFFTFENCIFLPKTVKSIEFLQKSRFFNLKINIFPYLADVF